MSSFQNLEDFAKASGFSHISVEFCEYVYDLQDANEWSGVPSVVQVEFREFIAGMRALLAPVKA